MSLTRWPTAQAVIAQVALECGLPATPDPYASTDPLYLQLCGLLNAAGRELVELNTSGWQQLSQSFSIVTTALDTGKYDLPADFSSLAPQTGWNRTTRLPLPGPLTEQQWEAVVGRGLQQTTVFAQFKEELGQVWIFPWATTGVVPAGQTLAWKYRSRGWVRPAGWVLGNPYADAAVAATDVVLYEAQLIERFLKLKFLTAKSLPADAAATDFARIFDSRTGKDRGGQILSVNGPRGTGVRLIDAIHNAPETGYGA